MLSKKPLTGMLVFLVTTTLIITCLSNCSSSSSEVIRTKETHESHIIDYSTKIEQGLKIADDRPIKVAIYKDSKVVGFEMKVLNGLTLYPENYVKRLEAIVKERS